MLKPQAFCLGLFLCTTFLYVALVGVPAAAMGGDGAADFP
ncbi:hypothetical protein RAS2_10790 [Phycisphaerae bacterium RAS2]|nr:hypothetical protein RAS2_10790 [Phycisphaerae bacterium RAS2]